MLKGLAPVVVYNHIFSCVFFRSEGRRGMKETNHNHTLPASLNLLSRMITNETGTAMSQNKHAQKPKLLFFVALASALFTMLLARISVETRGATSIRKLPHNKPDGASVEMTKEPNSTRANASSSAATLRNHLRIKPEGANTSVEMNAATSSTKANAGSSAAALSNQSHFKSNRTIVTGFYEGPSKHSLSKYIDWAKNLFTLQDPMILFTEPSFANFVEEQRALNNATHKTKIVLLDLNKTDTVNMFDLDFWKEQHLKDKKAEKHKSYHVYWVWLSKLEFIRRAIEMNPFQSEFFAWVDLGYFRSDRWLGQKLLQHIPNALQEDQVLMLDHHHIYRIGAGFIGGYVKGLLRFNKVFYDNLKKQQYTEFIGREEPMLAESCLEEPNLCQLVVSGKQYKQGSPPVNGTWFYMAPFMILGQNETEASMYIPTKATDQIQSDMVNRFNVIKPPELGVILDVLMVVAHPDDEVLWGGEFLLREGENVHLVVTSTLNRKTSIRYDEFRAVQKHLGFHGEFLDGKDSSKTTELERHIQQRIQTLICGRNWKKIITHGPEGEYGHPHHQMVHDAVLDAVKMCCRSSDKLFVFEPHPTDNHVFSEAKQAVAKLYESQKNIIFRTFGEWKERIVPFDEYDYKAANKICRDNRDPKKKVHKFRQCRLHEMFDFSSSSNNTSVPLETFLGQGSGC